MRRRVLPLMLLLHGTAAGAACWQPDPAASDVQFAATQAGAPIEGAFRKFTGHICIDEAQPERGLIDVSIDTASVDMGLPEFDEAMRGADFFDVARWPAARFVSTGIRPSGTGRYIVAGRFTIRDRTRDVEVPFKWKSVGGAARVEGEMTLKRLDYDIGLSQWRDTRWVGDEVLLRFSVALKPE
jgi:polyisoprenoid-binding protein YceI